MRLLYIADVNSPLVCNLAIELKKCRPGLAIDIISDAEPRSSECKETFDLVIAPTRGAILRKLRGVKFFWYAWQHRRSLDKLADKYDAVHLFYLSAIWGVWAARVRRKAPRMIITLFGSDVYRSFWPLTFFQKRLLVRSDRFTTSNPHTVGVARRIFGLELTPCDEILFGLRSLEHLKSSRAGSRMESRSILGIAADAIVVACGYNGSMNQNHMSIIHAVRGLPTGLRDRLHLLFPMTSGGTTAYMAMLEDHLRASGLRYRIFSNRLDDIEVARIRLATDLLVQVQNTDQLSGSMLEHLFAGSVLLTGSWLPYDMMAEQGLRYWTTPSLGQLQEELAACVVEIEERRSACMMNPEIVWRMTAWTNTAPRWASLYDD